MDTDDPQVALEALRRAAQAAEPGASDLVRVVADATGGTVERFDSRFKTDDSILEKLERFREGESPHYRLAPFNDALRYTLTYPEVEYWDATRRALIQLETRGYTAEVAVDGWRRNYAGLNVTVVDPAERLFEVQLHTPASLAAAQRGHPLYVERRRLPRDDPRARRLRRQGRDIAASVPWPPGVPRV